MPHDLIHDFRKGGAAELLMELGHEAIVASSPYTMPALGKVAYQDIETDHADRFMHRKHEDVYLMFAYLPEYNTKKYGQLPVFHTSQCDTRKQYSGFVFAQRMPVDIWSRDENKTYKDEALRMCGNCKREHTKALFGAW